MSNLFFLGFLVSFFISKIQSPLNRSRGLNQEKKVEIKID